MPIPETTVVRLFAQNESVEQFVAREAPVSTTSVVRRFGYGDRREALRDLRRLEQAGRIKCERGYIADGSWAGIGHCWSPA